MIGDNQPSERPQTPQQVWQQAIIGMDVARVTMNAEVLALDARIIELKARLASARERLDEARRKRDVAASNPDLTVAEAHLTECLAQVAAAERDLANCLGERAQVLQHGNDEFIGKAVNVLDLGHAATRELIRDLLPGRREP